MPRLDQREIGGALFETAAEPLNARKQLKLAVFDAEIFRYAVLGDHACGKELLYQLVHAVEAVSVGTQAKERDIRKGAFLVAAVVPFFRVFVDIGRGITDLDAQLAADAEGEGGEEIALGKIIPHVVLRGFSLFRKLGKQ